MAIRIIKHFGLKPQLLKLIEECFELIIAILRYLITGKGYANLLEEMADVQLVSDQIIAHFNESEYIYNMKHYKKERTLKYIESLKKQKT